MNRSLFFLYSSFVTLFPAIFLIPVYGVDTALVFLTGDAFLYLGIAESSTTEFFSFDGEAPTNGFHPLWQGYVWFLAQLTDSQTVLMHLTAWSAIALCLIGIWLLGLATVHVTGSWLLAGLMTPGVYFLLIGQGIGNLSVWNFFSGMEAGLALAFTGVIGFLVVRFRQDEGRLIMWLVLGVALGGLMLTRLDDVFVGPAIALCWLFWHPAQFWRRIPAVLALGIPPAAMLALYWYYNLTHVGVLMPISGAAKGDGALLGNGWVTAAAFIAPLIDLRAALTDYVPAHDAIRGGTFRVAEVVFPGLIAVFFMWLIRHHFRDQPWAPFVAGMCGAIVIKASYNFAAVNYWHQSAWYYSFAFGTISFATALMLAPVLRATRAKAPALPFMLACLVIMVSLMQGSQAYFRNYTDARSLNRIAFLQVHKQVEAELLEKRPGAKLLEFGDGFLNFVFDMPVRHGFVFAGDPKSLDALRENRLLSSSYEDGYTILSSFEYIRWPDASVNSTSEEIREHLRKRTPGGGIAAELDAFEYEIIYFYEPLSIPFIALTAKEE